MERVKIDLKNCYGIKALNRELDFKKARAYAIYAPNGVMKSSLAQTFQDAAKGEDSRDRIFPDRKTERHFHDEAGKEIEGERVLVVGPYDPDFGPTEKTSTLLVDPRLRKEYEQLQLDIAAAKAAFLKAIRAHSGSKADFQEEIIRAFTADEPFEVAVGRIRDELSKQTDAPFSDANYDVIFDPKVEKALESSKDLKTAIAEYIKHYNQLLAGSTYFRKGMFDYYNAGQIAKSLADNGFFAAKHTVTLKASGGDKEISTERDLEAIISEEKQAILTNPKLVKSFDAVAKQLDRNAELRTFCRYLQDNAGVLSRMDNPRRLKGDVLKSYIKVNYDVYLDMMSKYDAAAKRKKEIEEEARKQSTQWDEVIEIFNNRFVVPFRLEARNKIEVMLGQEAIPALGFTYMDGGETVAVEEPELLKALSTGERKALYIVQVIFEVQRRAATKTETLLVVDDIADSFDYQNKYAIVQYLKDISEDGQFKLIIMTHNFDFFRTIGPRFVGYANCLMASKNPNGLSLVPATGIKNIFANDWKLHFFTDTKKKIASIAFLRNLIEMTTGERDPAYIQLTSMLHWRSDTGSITVKILDDIFNKMCGESKASPDQGRLVWQVMIAEAKNCLGVTDGLGLENKIVLAMATRITAERFMIRKINDDAFVAAIQINQTNALVTKYKTLFQKEKKAISVLDRVALMTPENIHVNAFMYEPIVDMSDEILKRLYREVEQLT